VGMHGIRHTMETLTQGQAGALRGLIARPVRRLIERVKRAGDPGLALRIWEPPLHRRLPEKVKATGLRRSAQWGDFGPTWAAEQLAERHGIAVSAATLRDWLLAKGKPHF
jgi:hypothetical protein